MIRSITHGTTIILSFVVLVVTAKEQLTFRVEPAARLFNVPDDNNENTNESNVQATNDKESMEFQDTDTASSGTTSHVFKILQLADLHWGEHLDTDKADKGKEQDDKTANAIQVYLETEQPDLVVFSGDQISSDFMVDNAREVHGQVISAMKNVNPDIKWCTLMGNHDDHPFEVVKDGDIVDEIPAKTSRKDLLEFDAQLDGSYTEPSDLSNYKLSLSLNDGSPAADVYVFDTGGGAMEKELSIDQVEWFKNESNDNVARPAIGFMHIPTRKGFEFKSGCVGEDSEEVRKIQNKPGILEAMVEQGYTHILGVGHNHGNDYCCGHDDPLHLCFGRHSGYGGYEEVSRGARVYELKLLVNDDNTRTFSWSSWVRLDTGETTNEFSPEQSYDYKTPLPPTQPPTNTPTVSFEPSQSPSVSLQPSVSPSMAPSSPPPTTMPSRFPSRQPSFRPTLSPSNEATNAPTFKAPTVALTLPPILSSVQASVVDTSAGISKQPKASIFYCCCLGTMLLLLV